jgi:hypothetical protein
VAYGLLYFGLLTLVSYGPPRYFTPLLVPLACLSAIACAEVAKWMRNGRLSRIATVPAILLLALTVVPGSLGIIRYFTDLRFSFLKMATSVGGIISQREGKSIGVSSLSHMSDVIALSTGVKSINAEWGTEPMRERVDKYRPLYVVTYGDEEKVLRTIAGLGGRLTKLGDWEVYGNYYYGAGKNAQLFAIDWSSSPISNEKQSNQNE